MVNLSNQHLYVARLYTIFIINKREWTKFKVNYSTFHFNPFKAKVKTTLNQNIERVCLTLSFFYLAYSIARDSRITVTLMCPG